MNRTCKCIQKAGRRSACCLQLNWVSNNWPGEGLVSGLTFMKEGCPAMSLPIRYQYFSLEYQLILIYNNQFLSEVLEKVVVVEG